MQSTIKTPVTVGTFFVTYTDDCPNATHKHLFFGKPTRKEMETAFKICFDGNAIKKVMLVDVERINLEIELEARYLSIPIDEIIENKVHQITDFESSIIH